MCASNIWRLLCWDTHWKCPINCIVCKITLLRSDPLGVDFHCSGVHIGLWSGFSFVGNTRRVCHTCVHNTCHTAHRPEQAITSLCSSVHIGPWPPQWEAASEDGTQSHNPQSRAPHTVTQAHSHTIHRDGRNHFLQAPPPLFIATSLKRNHRAARVWRPTWLCVSQLY